MTEMSKAQIGRFLMQGTLTGKPATVKKDGSPHVVPIWFVLNKGNSRGKVGDIIFTTGDTSVKANNIQRDNRVSICVDDQIPPFSFVTIFGTAKIYPYKQKEVFKWAKKIAERYMGKRNAEAYGRRNSEEGEVLVRIKPTRILAEKDIAAWEWRLLLLAINSLTSVLSEFITNAAVVDDVIKFVSGKSSSIKPWLEKEKHKVEDAVTVYKKRDNNNDIQGPEEENRQKLQSAATTNTLLWQITEQAILDLEYRRIQAGRCHDKRRVPFTMNSRDDCSLHYNNTTCPF